MRFCSALSTWVAAQVCECILQTGSALDGPVSHCLPRPQRSATRYDELEGSAPFASLVFMTPPSFGPHPPRTPIPLPLWRPEYRSAVFFDSVYDPSRAPHRRLRS